MKRNILLLSAALLVLAGSVDGQTRLEGWDASRIDERLMEGRWPAQWISVQDMVENERHPTASLSTFPLTAGINSM